jgi:hypothetical protein
MSNEIGKWHGGALWEWPEEWDDWKEDVNTVATTLIQLLDIAVQALELAKAFIPSYIDPISAIVAAIVEEIQSYVKDLQQSGAYAVGDWSEIYFKYPFLELKGGFTEYEKRMVGRLTDWKDPNRPNLSTQTKTLALFFYATADVTEIQRLKRLIQTFMRLFDFKSNMDPLPQPINLEVQYGTDGMSIFSFGPLFSEDMGKEAPAVANLTWDIARPVQSEYTNIVKGFVPPVDGWIVEVSTAPDGMKLLYDRPKETAKQTKEDAGGNQKKERETGYLEKDDGSRVTLWGGGDQLKLDEDLWATTSFEADGTVTEGRQFVYGQISDADSGKSIIPLEWLKEKEGNEWKYYLQRTFMVGQLASSFSPGQSYTISLNLKDLPRDADFEWEDGECTRRDNGQPTTFYARVRACTDLIENSVGFSGTPSDESFAYKFDLNPMAVPSEGPVTVQFVEDADGDAPYFDDLGEPSTPVVLTFPDEIAYQFLEAVEAAIIVLALCRPDYTILADDTDLDDDEKTAIRAGTALMTKRFLKMADSTTGLEGFYDLLVQVMGDNYEKRYSETKTSVTSFRLYLIRQARQIALDLYGLMGRPMPALEKKIVEQTKNLRETKLGLVAGRKSTILEAAYSTEDAFGIAANVFQVFGDYPPTHTMEPEQTNSTMIYYSYKEKPIAEYEDMLPASEISAARLVELNAKESRQYKLETVKGSEYYVPYVSPPEASYETYPAKPHTPIFYDLGISRAIFARTVITTGMYNEAAMVLNLVAAAYQRKGSGEWKAYRFFSTLPNFMDFMKSIENWLKAIQESIKAVGDALKSYINFVQARVIELQMFIRKINQLIQSLQMLAIPSGHVLLTFSDGTDGVLSDLQSAENKPYDGATAYGAGALLVLPLAPIPATELIVDLLAASSEDD